MINMLLSASSVFTTILYIFLAIVVLLFMIMVHEFGHYTAGKLLKFKINEFSIGFGKAIISKTKKNGEKFSLRIFPLGGYCAFEGEDEDEKDNPEAFNAQKPWKRLIVLFMGAFFNFLSAIIFAVVFLMAFGYNDRVQIKSLEYPEELPSYVVTADDWFKKGDVIYAVNGKETNFVYDEYFTTLVSEYKVGEKFTVSVYRDGKSKDLTIQKSWFAKDTKTDVINAGPINEKEVTLYALDGKNFDYYIENVGGQLKVINKNKQDRSFAVNAEGMVTIEVVENGSTATESFYVEDLENGNFAISSSKIGVVTQNYRYGFFEAIGRSFVFCFGWAWKILIILGQLITGQLAITSMGGTVTTIVTIAEVTQTNIASLLLLIPLISINLAVFNLLPFPALDGARMVFVFIEWIRKKPISRKVEGIIHFIGLIALLVFVVIVDILHFVL
ncbi:MAG: RIP metalloprotease RseP [Clostridia bacterium]|nr:RIP metalloprotease RseP [Clostridia bacterium]